MSDRHVYAVLRNAVERIKEHEAHWLEYLHSEVPSYCPEDGYVDDEEAGRMDEIQEDQAFSAQELLRDLLKRFEEVTS
ncbi:hypothetical protein GCM10010218_20040 [Streptomyces mashuensis]|uniref:Uncharacterized protein n=1 Tax=Streptomyces mashuensis TaxID=33904 RepID=A0A919B1F8_9ACTN|nr:hypothetical protein [Streptomyces mashuensis]GHF38793.1 hypothetical protein GCM10010218_20040 [Streptomyces mashuensis]